MSAVEESWTRALERILELTVLLHQDAARGLARDGLTTSRATLLWKLREIGPAPQRRLAEELDVSPRNVTGLVDALEATGFVTREHDPADRRASLVTLTEHGASVVERLRRQRDELARDLFGAMPETRFDAFTAGLDDVLRRLHTLVAEEARAADGAAPS
ncbi:MarR family winged helix-turn-helix transcriptional regulator [Marinitenerispora sediminis]|uniref:MarR family transcriptional regulator n=1 Tax=Marinitenerispora sediminis TaxID=1931232 RepID=A0A368T0L7_9ACTN|nr:MarR family transcriptional regulator [Marinitenerispora sediminis]RCV48362.1 MarR family transcriptional regulator [Marinitenerispora sediminis]RCV49756.1 MarR family transcriptional regulator [Marinitenerispora sediminis]RCV52557.1 MarR family transcriptional regulator [Marinitenerispora sediminis]